MSPSVVSELTIDAFAWITGRWVGEYKGRTSEMICGSPRFRSIQGAYDSYIGDQLFSRGYMTLIESNGQIELFFQTFADPSLDFELSAAAKYTLVDFSETSARFHSNLESPFDFIEFSYQEDSLITSFNIEDQEASVFDRMIYRRV
jgi:hypothetical protein